MPTPIQTPGITAGVDQRGLVSVEIPIAPISLDEFLSYSLPLPFGTVEIGRSLEDRGNGTYKLKIRAEGIEGIPGAGEAETFEFDSSLSEEPIETFPDILEIRKNFGGQVNADGKVIFPETLTTQLSRNVAGLKGGNSKSVKNPYFGVTTWFSFKSIFRHTYLRKTVPTTLLDRIGTIEKRLPKGFPTPSGRNWLVMPPRMVLRGNVYEISEERMLSAPGGWHPEIYKFIR